MNRKYSLAIGFLCVAAAVVSIATAQQAARKPSPNKKTPQAAKSPFGSDALKRPIDSFVLTSPAVKNEGQLPAEFTGDGAGSTLPLTWQGAPTETLSFAIIMDHQAPDGMKSYWTMWDIPANINSLPKNSKGIGKVGGGFRGRLGYEPPRSKGPGEKIYVLTIYALSSPLQIAQSAVKVNRDVLLAAMKDKVLASSSLKVAYTRSNATQNDGQHGEGQHGEGQRRQLGQNADGRNSDAVGQRQNGTSKPMFPLLDSNRDGILDRDEIQKAAAVIQGLDKNNDQQITREEIPGGGQDDRERKPRPKQPNESPRR